MCSDRSFTEIDAERLDELGFLDQARSPRLRNCDQLLSGPVAWVLGRPWIGKSTVAGGLCNRLRAESSLLPGVDGRVCLTRLGFADAERTVPPAWWETWVADSYPSTAAWLIDGVDEAIDSNLHLLGRIAEVIETAPVEHLRRLRLLLFSRPGR